MSNPEATEQAIEEILLSFQEWVGEWVGDGFGHDLRLPGKRLTHHEAKDEVLALINTEVCKALDSIELPNAEILTTKYGHNSTEKKYGYSVAMFEANDAIAKVKAEYEVK